jgi:hypothetical protein
MINRHPCDRKDHFFGCAWQPDRLCAPWDTLQASPGLVVDLDWDALQARAIVIFLDSHAYRIAAPTAEVSGTSVMDWAETMDMNVPSANGDEPA